MHTVSTCIDENPPHEPHKILASLQSASKEIEMNPVPQNEDLRKSALGLAKGLVAALEKPEEVVMRWGFELGSQQACLRIGIDLRLFRMLAEKDGSQVSAADMAEESRAELLFVVRIMRVITSIGFAAEVSPQHYISTALTEAISMPAYEATVRSSSNDTVQISATLPGYFDTHGYRCPTDGLSCPFQWTFDTRQSYFDWTHNNPQRSADLNTCMKAMRSTRKSWIDWYPVEKELLTEVFIGEEGVLLVDVGGGKGHDLEKFLLHFPDANGRLILQDLPQTLDSIDKLDSRIELVPHDFFCAQPIKGARGYYTHFVFHNWADDRARAILIQLKAAMVPGYSKLILNESVMPDMNCPAFFAAGDINMLSILAGMKRSYSQWIELLHSVGFDAVRVRVSPYVGDEEGVIEAMLVAKDQKDDISERGH